MIKISRKVVVNSYANGGLKMLNLECIQKSLKSTWIKRLLDEPEIHINWKCFINNILTQTIPYIKRPISNIYS